MQNSNIASNATHELDYAKIESRAWDMFCLLVRLRNITPDHPICRSQIYRDVVELVEQLRYRYPPGVDRAKKGGEKCLL